VLLLLRGLLIELIFMSLRCLMLNVFGICIIAMGKNKNDMFTIAIPSANDLINIVIFVLIS
jgi:hypothetical protein